MDPRWYQRVSLRARMLAIAAVATAVVLAVGGFLLLSLLRSELIETAQDDGLIEAERVAAMARAGDLPRELSRTGTLSSAVQVVVSGKVVSGTMNAVGRPSLVRAEQQVGETKIIVRARLPIDENGPFRIIALGTETPTGVATVYVVVDVEDIEDYVNLAGKVGGFGLLALVLALSGVFWIVIGRTLAPVTAIQERADAISASELHRRVPEPVGRDEIAELARTINAMLGRLESSAKRQEAFVADAAHELRSPIASLQARLETVQGAGTPVGVGVVRDLLHETVRMARLIDHLLLLARSDEGRFSTGRVPVDLDDLIRDAVSSSGSTAIGINTEQVEPVQVLGRPEQLGHVVTNLLDNAGRYADSAIDITLRAQDEVAILTVDDDGPGIPEHLREEVLRRFVRLDDSRERGTGGAGLGLAIVSEIVRTHAGEIEVADSPSGGARFRVRLPLT